MIDWAEKTITYFKDASEYTGFHKELAAKIKPYLKPEWTLCDLGCGLGLLDIQLSDSVAEITAIDQNEKAIKDYNKRINELGIKNITAKVGDVNEISDERWDVLLLSFFGNRDELGRLLTLARHKAVIISFGNDDVKKDRQNYEHKYKSTTESKEAYLDANGYSYIKIENTMEFGQPIKSIEDAHSYFDAYLLEEDANKRKSIIEKNMEGVVPAYDDEKFPYYFSKKKDIGILIVDIK